MEKLGDFMRLPERPPYVSKKYNYSTILDELRQMGRDQELFAINDNKYPYWDKWKYMAKEWDYDAKKLWAAVKALRLDRKIIQVSSIEKFTFKMDAPSIVQNYLHEFDLHLGGSLQGESIIPTEEKDRYLISSLMEEAIASSQLEGAVTTRKVAKEMLENNRKPRNTSEQIILNNYEGMKWIVANKHKPFTIANIKHVHSIITRNTLALPTDTGTFREDSETRVIDVQTGGTVYTPPTHDKLDQLMEDFCRFANDSDKQHFFIHPITKAVFLHFLIGYIHPFTDGNGRTARTIFYWYLLKKGYWLIEYMSVSRIILASKAQYARAYLHTELDENDLTYFLVYNLKSIHIALGDLKNYIQRKTTEKKNILALIRNMQYNDRQIDILQEMIKDANTYFTVLQVQNKYGVSNQTARNDLVGLVDNKLLEENRRGKKSQFFPAKDFLKQMKKEMGG